MHSEWSQCLTWIFSHWLHTIDHRQWQQSVCLNRNKITSSFKTSIHMHSVFKVPVYFLAYQMCWVEMAAGERFLAKWIAQILQRVTDCCCHGKVCNELDVFRRCLKAHRIARLKIKNFAQLRVGHGALMRKRISCIGHRPAAKAGFLSFPFLLFPAELSLPSITTSSFTL